MFQVTVIASGTDGVTNGTGTFTSATGNFQSSMIGLTIRIGTKGAYTISAVASATSITIVLPGGGAASPSAGSSLAYNVGPETPYIISSVDSNTQLTLSSAWSGPTLTGLAFTTWKDIRYIADESGVNTDGIGGEVRISGSDNDQTTTRANAIVIANSYRTFIGFHLDTTSTNGISITSGTNIIVQQCGFQGCGGNDINVNSSAPSAITIRKCFFIGGSSANTNAVLTQNASTVDNTAILLENNLAILASQGNGFMSSRIGGILIRNCTLIGGIDAARVQNALSVGQATTMNNCIIVFISTGLVATTTAEFIEDRNVFYGNTTNRNTVTAGANSVTYPPLLLMPLLTLGLHSTFFAGLNSLSAVASITGFNPPGDDLYSKTRAATSSYGDMQYFAGQRFDDAGPSHSRRFGAS